MTISVKITEHTLQKMQIEPKDVAGYATLREWITKQQLNGGYVDVDISKEKPRSSPHHRKFFGVIAAAFTQWPESHEFQPEDEDHLRQWLEVAAGHRAHQDFPITEENAPQVADMMVHFATAIDGKKVFPRFGNGVVRLYWAESVAWSKLSQSDFNRVSKPCFDIIENVIGVPVDELRKKTEMAA